MFNAKNDKLDMCNYIDKTLNIIGNIIPKANLFATAQTSTSIGTNLD